MINLDFTSIVVISVFGFITLMTFILTIILNIDANKNISFFGSSNATENTVAVYDSNGKPVNNSDITVVNRVMSNVSDIISDKNFTYTTILDNAKAFETNSLVTFVENVQSSVSVISGSFSVDNLEGGAKPSATDDSDSGYSVGSRWVDVVGLVSYVCYDATVGNAVWVGLSTVDVSLDTKFFEWQSFTPSWVQGPTWGANYVEKAYYKIINHMMYISYYVKQTNAGTSGLSRYRMILPGGWYPPNYTDNLGVSTNLLGSVNNEILTSVIGKTFVNDFTNAEIGQVCMEQNGTDRISFRTGSLGGGGGSTKFMSNTNYNGSSTNFTFSFIASIPVHNSSNFFNGT
jgi:hypothetical protein